MVCRMSRYELHCPPPRQWPAIWRARFLWLYETAIDRVLPWQWMCSALFLPGTPGRTALDGLAEAALSREVEAI